MLNYKHMILALSGAAVFAAHVAIAADPVKTVKPDENQHLLFEKARLEAQKTRQFVPPMPIRETKISDFPCIVEKMMDGMLVVSVPYDKRNEKALEIGGYREAKSREEAGDHMRFDGRIFSTMQLEVQDEIGWLPFQKMVGKEVVLKLKVDNYNRVSVVDGRIVR